jgi:hypothetical protein
MAEFFEDTDPRPLGVETQLLAGVTPPNLNQLLTKLRLNVLGEQVPHAVARMITKLATTAEPGTVFFGLIEPRFLDVRFRSKQNMADIDTALQPFYGSVRPALTELQVAGIDVAVTEFWLNLFRKDNAIYRVYVVNAMCLAAATRELS